MSPARVGTAAAVDLGATSGRVMLGHLGSDGLRLEEVARFPNSPVRTPDGLHWSVTELYRNVVEGLAEAVRRAPELTSIGIDSWAVDYALLRDGRMLGEPYSYRDERNLAAVEVVHARVSAAELYARNGLQHLPFNTLFQLTADRLAGTLDDADSFLLLPDLLAFWLTGRSVAERTNASTTGLVEVSSGEWDTSLMELLDLPPALARGLVDPGTVLGPLLPTARRGTGSSDALVTTVGSHDTASAVVAVPSTDRDVAYISSGTWSLVGVELDRPVLGEASRLAGFTNEGGVDGRVRYLHNVMGLWLLSESVRDWERSGERVDLGELLAAAEQVEGEVPVFDADDPVFLAPGGMPDRIAAWFAERGMRAPASRAELTRSILESLAEAYAATLRRASELSGVDIRTVHLVGGGSQNALLCRLTARATGLPVVAGPVEATAIGNVLVQARAHGLVSGDLEALRALVIRDFPVTRYLP
ncbi:rhamnulokinase family protein [Homoserinibacter sp. GY 40078]|uniref:rhamnulokinase n=1 Tax=Homoserinibacter sp. GY 40078 TaxID=2603275 RepID=UPI0011CA8FE2|nr:rhamnulokinase family protein [Homoserinibacter sp. GY 40078]TXK19438.1 rhamnulokinase [Homoserinibacter sp. GY 40078]